MYRFSLAYGFGVLYSSLPCECKLKKQRFGDALSAVAAIPIRSSRKTASQKGWKIRSPESDFGGNCAYGNCRLVNNPLTKKTSIDLTKGVGESGPDTHEN